MSADRYNLLLQDAHVDLRKAPQVQLWTDVLDIYTADLVDAVTIAGSSSSDVLKYIIDNGLVGNRFSAPKPRPKRAPEGGSQQESADD